MRKSVLLARATASFVLAGCEEAAEEAAPEDSTTEEAATEEVASVSADGGPSAGTFEVTQADGTTFTYTSNPDGTYVATSADGTETETGTWRQDGPNRWCDTATGEEEECYIEEVDENGVYTSTSEGNPEETSTIVRVN